MYVYIYVHIYNYIIIQYIYITQTIGDGLYNALMVVLGDFFTWMMRHASRRELPDPPQSLELGWICCWEILSSQLPDPLNSGIILTWRWICWTVLGWIWMGHTLINAMQVQSPCSASCTCCGSNPGLQLQCTVWHWQPLGGNGCFLRFYVARRAGNHHPWWLVCE